MYAQIDVAGITPFGLTAHAPSDKPEGADLWSDMWVGLTTATYLGEEKR